MSFFGFGAVGHAWARSIALSLTDHLKGRFMAVISHARMPKLAGCRPMRSNPGIVVPFLPAATVRYWVDSDDTRPR